MELHRAEKTDRLEMAVGEGVDLESLRQAVVPPYLMIMPFLEVPDEIRIEGQRALEEDGVHGCVYQLRARAPCECEITVGFRDLQTGEVTHRKLIATKVR